MLRTLTFGFLLTLVACDKQKQYERLKEVGIDSNSPVGLLATVPTTDNLENTKLFLTQPKAFAKKALQPIHDGIPTEEIVQIAPQSVEACFEKTNKVINEVFARCRRGARERWRVFKDGRRIFIQDLPVNSP